jgi:hypothetical protein
MRGGIWGGSLKPGVQRKEGNDEAVEGNNRVL